MKPLIFCGYQNTGKTAFIEKAVKALRKKGYSVSTIKHAPTSYETEPRCTDSRKLLAAGSSCTALLTGNQNIFFRSLEMKDQESARTRLNSVFKEFTTDFTLIEGFKSYDGPVPRVVFGNSKEEVEELIDDLTVGYTGILIRELNIKNPPYIPFSADENVVRSFIERNTFNFLPDINCRECGFSSCRGLAKKILEGSKTASECTRIKGEVQLFIDDREITIKNFVRDALKGVVKGFVQNLRGYRRGELKVIIRS
ncbi:MAG: molybdopterin-guanine dinucleotide biosynthesis protein B [Spirochaetota bacterium]